MLNLTFLIALGSPQNPPDSELLAAFAALAAPQQQQVLRGVATRLQEVPGAGRIRKLAAAIGQPRQRPPRPWHHSAEFAPVAPSRTVIDRGSPRHDRVRAAFPVINQDRDGQPTWTYDWGCGRIVRSLPEPGPGSRFASLLAGRPAGSDAATAAILQHLDSDGTERDVAAWFGHLYADRNGRVFADVTLYEAWYSNKTVEVPDIDAIAFARKILRTRSFVSPIPAGSRRDRLYRQISRAFAEHRQYRTLREAAAASFVAAEPPLESTYRSLIPRMHLLWSICNFDIGAVERRLAAGDRSELLQDLDARLEASAEPADQLRQQLLDLASATRSAAIAELAKARGR